MVVRWRSGTGTSSGADSDDASPCMYECIQFDALGDAAIDLNISFVLQPKMDTSGYYLHVNPSTE